METYLEFTGNNGKIIEKSTEVSTKYREAVKDIKKNIKDKNYKTAIIKIDLAKGYLKTMKAIVSAINTDTTDDVYSSVTHTLKVIAGVTAADFILTKDDGNEALATGKVAGAAAALPDIASVGLNGKTINHYKAKAKLKIDCYDARLSLLKGKVLKLMANAKEESKEDKSENKAETETKESVTTKLNIYESYEAGLITESEKDMLIDMVYESESKKK